MIELIPKRNGGLLAGNAPDSIVDVAGVVVDVATAGNATEATVAT